MHRATSISTISVAVSASFIDEVLVSKSAADTFITRLLLE